MSLFRPASVQCPNCGTPSLFEAVGSVNADRRPDLRDAILDNSFQMILCKSCGASYRLEPEFNFLDVGRRQWIAVMPARKAIDFLEVEDQITDLFDDSYGARAPAAARELGKSLDVRLVFGWPAIREKLLLRAHSLDDVVAEMMKLDILRRVPSAPMEPGVDMRVAGVSDDFLAVVWCRADTEETLSELTVPREIYNGIVRTREAWGAISAALTEGPFVDMQKTFMGEGRSTAAE